MLWFLSWNVKHLVCSFVCEIGVNLFNICNSCLFKLLIGMNKCEGDFKLHRYCVSIAIHYLFLSVANKLFIIEFKMLCTVQFCVSCLYFLVRDACQYIVHVSIVLLPWITSRYWAISNCHSRGEQEMRINSILIRLLLVSMIRMSHEGGT